MDVKKGKKVAQLHVEIAKGAPPRKPQDEITLIAGVGCFKRS